MPNSLNLVTRLNSLTWEKSTPHGTFLVSTQKHLIQPDAINRALELDQIYWTKPLKGDDLDSIIENSLCFGLYERLGATGHDPLGDLAQVGFARVITDYTTVAYGTDYYVLPEYHKLGLGEWLIDCFVEVLDVLEGAMDRSVRGLRVVTLARETMVGWYEGKTGMRRVENGEGGLWWLCRTSDMVESWRDRDQVKQKL